MSLDDKRKVMLDVFQQSRDVYVIKDIEKFSVKKGIISQSVKEVLQVKHAAVERQCPRPALV